MVDYRVPGYGELAEWDYPPTPEDPYMDVPIPGDLYTRPPDPLSPGGLGPASGLSTRARLRGEASGLFTGPNSFARTAWETAKSLPGTIARAVDFPAASLRGEVDPLSDEGLGRAADLAGTVTLGGGAVPRAVPGGSVMRSGMGQGPIRTAAIRVGDQVYAGPTHGDIMSRMPPEAQKAFWDQYNPKNEGFVTNKGDFVDREQAFQMAYKSGQIEDTLTGQPSLSSEDLEFGRRPSLEWDDDLYSNRDKTAGAIPLAMDHEAQIAYWKKRISGGEWKNIKELQSWSAELRKLQEAAPEKHQWRGIKSSSPNAKPGDHAVVVDGKVYSAPVYHHAALDDAARQNGYPDAETWEAKRPDIFDQDESQYGWLDDDLGFKAHTNRSVAAGAVPLFSRMEREAAALPQPKAPGQQWSATLKNRGVPNEELDWTGVADWLKERGTLPVTKEELLAEIGRRQTKVETKRLGEQATTEADLQRFEESLRRDHPDWSDDEIDEAVRGQGGLGSRSPVNTKYQQYQLPGGENYREVLLTLPENISAPERNIGNQLADHWKRMREKYGERYSTMVTPEEQAEGIRLLDAANAAERQPFKSSHWDEPNVLAHMRVNDRWLNIGPRPKMKEYFKWVEEKTGKEYEQLTPAEDRALEAQWNEERRRAEGGQRVLFAEEIQSDWHQKGRREGYQAGQRPKYIVEGNGPWVVRTEDGRFVYDTNIREVAENTAQDLNTGTGAMSHIDDAALKRGVPNAPFKKSWPDLALRRLVADAVEGGYDAVAWTDGATQAARYDLSKQVDIIDVRRNTDGSFDSTAVPKGSTNPIDVGRSISLEKLSEFIGKELAEKAGSIQPGGRQTFTGVDLQVGGEGMRAFYDQELPRRAKKLFGRYGATVEDTNLPGDKVQIVRRSDGAQIWTGDRRNAEGFMDAYTQGDDSAYMIQDLQGPQIHILRITPEMRAAIQSEGLPLFSNKSKAAGVTALAGEKDPNRYYRGQNPGDTRRIKTGDDEWDSYFFVSDDPDKAKMYGEQVTEYQISPGANILREGTRDFVKIAGRWRKGENMLQFASRAARAAKEAGYDGVHFNRQGDIGTAIFNKDSLIQRPITGGRFKDGGTVTLNLDGEEWQMPISVYQGSKMPKLRGKKTSAHVEDRRASQEAKVNRTTKIDPRPLSEVLIDPTEPLFNHKPPLRGGTPLMGKEHGLMLPEVTVPQNGDLWTDGLIEDPTPGRTDRLPTDMPADSYVIPADIVSALGQGNTLAGGKILDAMFSRHENRTARAEGGSVGSTVPVIVAGGEYTVSPDKVLSIGGGDHKNGHKVLDAFVLKTRKNQVKHLKRLPGPAKS